VRILHVESGRHLYGGALQVCYLLEGLSRCGVENHLLCTEKSEIATAAAPFAEIDQIPMHGDADFSFPFRLLGVARRHNPDLLHLHSRRGVDIWGGVCGRILGIPSLITRRVDNREWPPFARLKYRTYNHLVAISEEICSVLLSEGVDPGRTSCIRSAVEHEKYQRPRNREWFAGEFSIPPTAPVIGVIAQLIPRKGHRYLIDILPGLRELFPELRVIFFGQGGERESLNTHIMNNNLAGMVTFAGFRNDMPEIFPCIDLVVHPALIEGLGVSLLQAASAGVPIVATRAGGIPEIVHDGVNGRLVEPGDSEELFRAISELLGNPDLRRRFGVAGRNMALSDFSVERMVTQYMELYDMLLRKSAGRGL